MVGMSVGEERALRILFVCTANICRSPTAELLARDRFGERSALFRSAGFLEADRAMPDELIRVLSGRGIEGRHHRSYQIDEASLAAADLVLTMESSHVQQATALMREAFPKVVPLKEAALAVERLGSGALGVGEILDDLNRDRDPRSYLGSRWDVQDPYGRRTQHYRRAVEEIEQLVGSVIGSLSR